MSINNTSDTNLKLLALHFSLQAGGVNAKLQVVLLKRNVFVYDWQQNGVSRDLTRCPLFMLLIGRWRWENKQQAFLRHWEGARDKEARRLCCRAWGQKVHLEQRVKYWPLASRNPTQVWLAFLKSREQWRNERSLSLDQKRSLPLTFLDSYLKVTTKRVRVVVGWELKGEFQDTQIGCWWANGKLQFSIS